MPAPSRPTPRKVLCWGAVLTCLIVATLLALWVLPSWLTKHPRVEGAERHTAVAAARVGIAAYIVAVGAVGTLAFTARTYRLTARTYRLTHTGQVTDRYTKAVGQLGDAARDVRIGAIYALERVAKDSPDDQPTIMEVLTAYVREHAPIEPRNLTGEPLAPAKKPPPAADVQAALTVIARRNLHPDERPIDLHRSNLAHADLNGAHLSGAQMEGADLDHAQLIRAHLGGARLNGARLGGADLFRADLGSADMFGAHLLGANLARAILVGASMIGADLRNAHLDGADLTGANFAEATLTEGALTTDQRAQVLGRIIERRDLLGPRPSRDKPPGE